MAQTSGGSGSGPQITFENSHQHINNIVDFLSRLSKAHGNTKISGYAKELETCSVNLECAFLLYKRRADENAKISEGFTLAMQDKEKEISSLKQEIDRLKVLKFDEFSKSAPITNAEAINARQPVVQTTFRAYARAAAKAIETDDKSVVTNHVVILQPKHDVDKTNSDQTFKMFKMTLDQNILLEKKIKIKGKKFTSKGRVVLTCGSKEQCEDLCKSMEKNLAVQAKVPVKKNPLIQILGVDELVSKENVFKMITSQNDLEEYSECKLDVKFEKVDRFGSKFVVAEVDPKLYKKLVSLGRVCIGCSSCPVKGHIRVLRCFKCNRFGHCKRECRNEMTCTVCAGPHDTKTCTEHGVKCTNCSWVNEKRRQRKQDPIDTGHRADSHGCPQYIRMRHIVENQYDFG